MATKTLILLICKIDWYFWFTRLEILVREILRKKRLKYSVKYSYEDLQVDFADWTFEKEVVSLV